MEPSTERLIDLLQKAPPERLGALCERHGVTLNLGIRDLADQIRRDGSNSFATLFRVGEGVEYDQVLRNVANQIGVTVNESANEATIEREILIKVLDDYMKNASPEEREEIRRLLGEAQENAEFESLARITTKGVFAALLRQLSAKVLAKLFEKLVLRIASRQAAKQAGKIAARSLGYAIPLLNAAMIGWTVIDLAGPAYRKTVPTVIEIALLRLEFGEVQEGSR